MTEKHTLEAPTEIEVNKKQKVDTTVPRQKGIAPIKAEYLLPRATAVAAQSIQYNDEDEGGGLAERDTGAGTSKKVKKGKKNRGQNKARKLVQPRDAIKLCEHAMAPGTECPYGENCKFEHDRSKYVAAKPEDLPGECPVFEAMGYCPVGIKCRWLHSHYNQADSSSVINEELWNKVKTVNFEINKIQGSILNDLQKRKFDFKLSEQYIPYMEAVIQANNAVNNKLGSIKKEREQQAAAAAAAKEKADSTEENQESGATEAKEESAVEAAPTTTANDDKKDNAAAYIEPPFQPAEKKKLYLNNAKIVSPLTTVGNLPYRRLMRTLGADYTYSEMALCLPVVQGHKSEWALPRAHSSEAGRFGVQLATATAWQAVKAAEAVASLTTGVSEINLNCGCPIDLVFRTGAGSALMDNPSRMIRLLNGMNAVSGEVPVTVKIRTGVRDDKATAHTLVPRLLAETNVAAITIHGRSRAQRYTKTANWEYIGDVAKIVREHREDLADEQGGRYTKPWVIGNGDVFSWEDWYNGIEDQGVDSIMVARGALIKPWIFEEIESRQHLDKTATERLEIIKKYANFGLEHWGSDEYGINLTRRFLCEFLSFTHRYIPVGLLEYLPAKINDRPEPWQGRNELETLMASSNYTDWIKISEMVLGPVNENFDFTPKHKSNAYEKPNAAATPAAN